MAGRNKEPIDLLLAKGKKHLTQKEIEERRASEVKVDLFEVKPPSYLNAKQKQEFLKLFSKLEHVKIITELDEEALARFIVTNESYKKISKKLQQAINKKEISISVFNDLQIIHDRLLKQVRELASDLGLTVTSRSKLYIPPSPPPIKENKFAKFDITNGKN